MIHLRHMPTSRFAAAFFRANNSTYFDHQTKSTDFLFKRFSVFVNPRSNPQTVSIPHFPAPIAFILDGSEQPILSSKDSLTENCFFSVKKSNILSQLSS